MSIHAEQHSRKRSSSASGGPFRFFWFFRAGSELDTYVKKGMWDKELKRNRYGVNVYGKTTSRKTLSSKICFTGRVTFPIWFCRIDGSTRCGILKFYPKRTFRPNEKIGDLYQRFSWQNRSRTRFSRSPSRRIDTRSCTLVNDPPLFKNGKRGHLASHQNSDIRDKMLGKIA